MTPQEISEYKMKWRPGTIVRIHSDLDWEAKQWCRKNLERHQWSMDTYTSVYEHSFFFENEDNAIKFANQFQQWVLYD
jgi:hypothetical protein